MASLREARSYDLFNQLVERPTLFLCVHPNRSLHFHSLLSGSIVRSLQILALSAVATSQIAIAAPSCASGEWVDLATIPIARQEHGTAAIDNSTIAVLGGIVSTNNGTETTDLLQIYDVPSDTWRTATAAPYKVNHPNVAAAGGKLYLLGGLTVGPTVSGLSMNWVASKACHVYDPVSDSWDALPDMPNGTERGSAIMGVHSEMIYLAGGMTVLMTGYQDAINSVLSFNTTSNACQGLAMGAAELPESRQHAAGSVVGDIFYVIGGRRYGQLNFRDTVFELDLNSITAGWSTSTGHMPTSRGGINGGAVGTKYYIFGGEGNVDSTTGVFNQTDVFDLESQQWTELEPMAVPRHGTQAVAIGDRVYIPGGGLQQDGNQVVANGTTTSQQPSNHFDAYCA